jgi:hypothetical protein
MTGFTQAGVPRRSSFFPFAGATSALPRSTAFASKCISDHTVGRATNTELPSMPHPVRAVVLRSVLKACSATAALAGTGTKAGGGTNRGAMFAPLRTIYFVRADAGLAAPTFLAAQRFLRASTIRFRPSGLSFLFLFAGLARGTAATTTLFGAIAGFLGRPAFFFPVLATSSCSRLRACCNLAISRSMLAIISLIAIPFSL